MATANSHFSEWGKKKKYTNMTIQLNYDNARSFISDAEITQLIPQIKKLHQNLEEGSGPGNSALGWLHFPSRMAPELIEDIQQSAKKIRDSSDVMVVIGIGGSYLGARAGISFLEASQFGPSGALEVIFAGQNLSSDYHADLLDYLAEKDFTLNVISKSGTTTEPAIAFRLLKDLLEKKYGEDQARERIIATTDKSHGALIQLANEKGYKTYEIPADVGGRYSVLTPVGLLPMAAAGIDIHALITGAQAEESTFAEFTRLEESPAYLYAVLRHLLNSKGKSIEIMASFHPALKYVQAWWIQLAGESEGKQGRGIFPTSVEYTTDLHSLGQWIQEGPRSIFETFILLESSDRQVEIPALKNDEDGLNYLAGKTLDFVNDKAYKGTAMAHLQGQVPNISLTIKNRTAESLGRLFYFFERAVAMTGYLLDVNPFNQPGVELYKNNMFSLLDKPGFEKGK